MPLATEIPASTSPLPLFALALASFGIGTTEFVIMGLLPDVAGDLHVTIPTAGLLVSGYALSVTLGTVLCALAPSYWLLMGARIVTALCHGAFFGLGSVVAASLVPPNKKAQEIAMMIARLAAA